MFKTILLSVLMFSSFCFADINGVWSGNLSINGKTCKPTSIEIKKSPTALSIYASLDKNGNHALECGPQSYKYYMWLEEDFSIKGSELWRYEMPIGQITTEGLWAKERFCDQNGCDYWDYIKIKQLTENKITIWVDFSGAILTGTLTR